MRTILAASLLVLLAAVACGAEAPLLYGTDIIGEVRWSAVTHWG